MKKILLPIVILTLFSCTKEKTESWRINNYEYIVKTDSTNVQVIKRYFKVLLLKR